MAALKRLGAPGMSGLYGLALGLQVPAQAAEPATKPERILAAGILLHDSGPFSDHHEDGIDLSLEAQFAPLGVLGPPRPHLGPHLGMTLGSQGETSVAYAGLGFRVRETSRWFADGIFGVAVHNGPLHKDPVNCRLYSDCGYGTRFMPHFGLEMGYQVGPAASVSVLFDHMSHKWIAAGENEGLDHVGVCYLPAY